MARRSFAGRSLIRRILSDIVSARGFLRQARKRGILRQSERGLTAAMRSLQNAERKLKTAVKVRMR